jgi:hypothetical protein
MPFSPDLERLLMPSAKQVIETTREMVAEG